MKEENVLNKRCVIVRFIAVLLLALGFASAADAAKQGSLERLTVHVEGRSLALWSRTVAKPRGVIVLIHGRTWSALPDFDLQVPGKQRSVMQALNEKGYSTYALDLRGYGKSPRDSDGWLTPEEATDDVAAALEWLAREKHVTRPTLLGWSMGSLVVHLLGQRHPESISNLVLYGFPRDVATLAALPIPLTPAEPPREKNTHENAVSDFISPTVTSADVVETYARAALAADPVRVDWKSLEQFAAIDPSKISVPTLLIHGERDPLAPLEAQAHLFTRLGSPDRQWVILAGGDHAALLEDTAPAFVAAIVAFIERPIWH